MNFIITGCSRGIGREVCRQLLDQGHQVLGISRSPMQDIWGEEGWSHLQADLSSSDSAEKISHKINDLNWEIDGLLNNAGQLINKPFLETTDEEFEKQFQANVISAVRTIQQVYPFLKRGAHLVNISSMGGFQGSSKFAGLSAYSTAKGALAILTECLPAELAAKEIRVNALCLGAVQTEMLEQAFPGFEAPLRAGEMADYIVHFLQEGGKVMNGRILPVALTDPN
jgi:NAD(P)-dependent dehydrogenase (short-subunit alcohol dehydrogenase family)